MKTYMKGVYILATAAIFIPLPPPPLEVAWLVFDHERNVPLHILTPDRTLHGVLYPVLGAPYCNK